MSEFEKAVHLVRADQVLLEALYTDVDRRVGFLEGSATETREAVAELQENVSALQDSVSGLQRSMAGLHQSVSGLYRTVSGTEKAVGGLREATRKVVGHSRLSSERFSSMLSAMQAEFTRAPETEDLRRRVEAIERKLAS